MSNPLIATAPLSGRSSPATIRNRVLLPAPLTPHRQTASPAGTARFTFLSTGLVTNVLLTERMLKAMVVMAICRRRFVHVIVPDLADLEPNRSKATITRAANTTARTIQVEASELFRLTPAIWKASFVTRLEAGSPVVLDRDPVRVHEPVAGLAETLQGALPMLPEDHQVRRRQCNLLDDLRCAASRHRPCRKM